MRPAWRGVIERLRTRKRLKPSCSWKSVHGVAGAFGDARADHDAGAEHVRGEGLDSRSDAVVRPQLGVGRDDDGAGQSGEPVGRNGLQRRLCERRRRRAGHDELVARELGVPLPLQPEGAEVRAEMVELPRRRVHPAARRQFAHVLPFALAARCVGGKGEEGQAQGCLQRFRRPRVHFRVQLVAQGVVRRQGRAGGVVRHGSLPRSGTGGSGACC